MTAGQPAQIACPQCGQIDQVQKVSAIVKAGTTTGALTGTTTGGGAAGPKLSHDSQTVLSKLLASPKNPGNTGWAFWQRMVWHSALIIVLAFLVGLATAQFVLVNISGLHDPLLVNVTQGLLVGFFAVVFGIIALLSDPNRAYARQRQKWKRTYYCHRCDGFFIPGVSMGKSKLVAPENMQAWLRAHTWNK